MRMADRIEQKLVAAFSPAHLSVIDESEAHRGHAGWREGGETHFRVEIAATAFAGMSRVARQRAVNQILADELSSGAIHALAMKVDPA